jgi:hypothetical protein
LILKRLLLSFPEPVDSIFWTSTPKKIGFAASGVFLELTIVILAGRAAEFTDSVFLMMNLWAASGSRVTLSVGEKEGGRREMGERDRGDEKKKDR